MDVSIILAIVSMLGFGITAIIYKSAANHIDSVSMVLLVYVFAAILTAILWFFVPDKNITKQGVVYATIAAIAATVSFIAFVEALAHGKAAVVTPIRNLSLVVTVVIAIVFLSEQLSYIKAIGVALAIGAVLLLSL